MPIEDVLKDTHAIIREARERAATGEKKPARDLAYCLCGTVWVTEAPGLNPDYCPDCEAEPVFIEYSD
jgi:hypothetical protein